MRFSSDDLWTLRPLSAFTVVTTAVTGALAGLIHGLPDPGFDKPPLFPQTADDGVFFLIGLVIALPVGVMCGLLAHGLAKLIALLFPRSAGADTAVQARYPVIIIVLVIFALTFACGFGYQYAYGEPGCLP